MAAVSSVGSPPPYHHVDEEETGGCSVGPSFLISLLLLCSMYE